MTIKRVRIVPPPAAPEPAPVRPRGKSAAPAAVAVLSAIERATTADAFADAAVQAITIVMPGSVDPWVRKEGLAIWALVARGDITKERAMLALTTNLKARIGAKLAKQVSTPTETRVMDIKKIREQGGTGKQPPPPKDQTPKGPKPTPPPPKPPKK